MNKTELIDAIAKDSGLTRADSARSIDSLITTVQKTLKKGDDVAITGFGKFSVAKRGARTGRNPATGAAINSVLRVGGPDGSRLLLPVLLTQSTTS